MTIPWYHKTTIYQIYPRSFYDSNGDGIGDLQGIIRKLDYLHDLGFETLWISPFFASPQADVGYDISDYMSIAPEYGSMADTEQLIEEIHKRGMRIVLDLVMNHTSMEHRWFQESRSSRDNPKADWYIWRDKPNNWQSMTGGTGWHFAPERGQYFWASFLPFQPDLNYRNPVVKKTMLDIARFWLGKGVDGFRLDIFNVIYKDAEFRDNPFSFKMAPKEDDPSGFFQEAKHNLNQPESFEFAKELRNVTEETGEKILLGEVSGNRGLIRKFLGDKINNGLGLVFDFGMLNFQFTAAYFRNLIQAMEANYPNPFMPVYVFSNHDRRRSIHKLGDDMRKAKVLAAFQLTIRGIPCFYAGEEIGMTNFPLPFSSALDPIAHKFKHIPRFLFDLLGLTINRDDVRTPMQWSDAKQAGFSNAEKTWLPVHNNYKEINIKKQSEDKDSLLNLVRVLNQLRKKEPILQEGSLELIEGLPAGILGYARILENKKIIVFLNFSEQPKEFQFDFSESILNWSANVDINKKAIHMDGLSGLILK